MAGTFQLGLVCWKSFFRRKGMHIMPDSHATWAGPGPKAVCSMLNHLYSSIFDQKGSFQSKIFFWDFLVFIYLWTNLVLSLFCQSNVQSYFDLCWWYCSHIQFWFHRAELNSCFLLRLLSARSSLVFSSSSNATSTGSSYRQIKKKL